MPLNRNEIKAGDRLQMRAGKTVQLVEVKMLLGDQGFMAQFGPVPWETLPMLERATSEASNVTGASEAFDNVAAMAALGAEANEAIIAKAADVTPLVTEEPAPKPKKGEPAADAPAARPAERKKTKSDEVAVDIAALLRARNPLIWIKTGEEARVESYVAQAAAAAKFIPRFWDCGQGVTDLASKDSGIGSADIGDTLQVIKRRAEEKSDRGAWIMRDLPPWLAGPGGMVTCRQVKNLARELPGLEADAAQALIVLSPSGDVPPELSNHATVIEWPMPDRNEIGALLDASIGVLPESMKAAAAPNGTREAAIDAAIGLSGEEAQACYAKSLVQHRKIDPLAVAKEKKRVIAREKVLEWFDPLPGGLEAVGGLELLKEWLLERRLAYSPQARDYGLPPPKGTFLAGIPGCGKTLTAKAIATAFNCPLLKLDLGALKGKFVGESEANMRKALRTIETIGRCVVLIDEIEKALAGATQGAADGGVSTDQLGALLQWMNEPHEAFVIATANDVTSITTNAPELMRAGRFDKIWFVDLPNRTERGQVLKASLRAYGRADLDLDYGDIIDATDTFTGSEIAAIIPDALYMAFADGGRQIETRDVVAAAKKVVPLSRTASDKITVLKEWAKGRAAPATAPEAPTERLKAVGGGRAIDIDG